MNHYIGKDGFLWWIGVVETTDDPLQLGRCRVRCFGHHPKRKKTDVLEEQDVPPEHLPWAICMMPTNLQNFYGRPNAGDWVLGFFLDASSAQEPVILGILPSIPEVPNDYFGMHPRFVKSFSKIKNDETTNRSQLINTLHNVVNKTSKELITLPAEGTYLADSEIESVRTTLSQAENRTQGTFAFYHQNGSLLEIDEKINSAEGPIKKILLKLNNGSNLELKKEYLNTSGDYTDYTKLSHNNGSSVNIKTDSVGGQTTSSLSLNEKSGASIQLNTNAIGEATITVSHPKGSTIVISPTGEITINSPENISVVSAKNISVSGGTEVSASAPLISLNSPTTNNQNTLNTNVLNAETINLAGVGNLASKIAAMDLAIALAMTLPVPA